MKGELPVRADRRRPSTRALVAGVVAPVLVVAAVPLTVQAAGSLTTRSVLDRTIQDPDINESSGLARSRYSSTRLWTHNDSGGGTTIYAIGGGGRTTATFELGDASHLDWEGMASARVSGVSYLFVGDIGDNRTERDRIYVHRVREPRIDRSPRVLRERTYTFRYPDGAHDAETLMVRPGSGRIYVATKNPNGRAGLYRAPRDPSFQRLNVLRRVGWIPAGITDGVFLRRGSFVLRGYASAWYFRRLGATPVRFSLPVSGESISAGFRRGYVFVGSEGVRSPIWKVWLP